MKDHFWGDPASSYPGPTWNPELARVAAYRPPVGPPPETDHVVDAAVDEVMALASKRAAIDGRIVEILAEHGDRLSGPDDLGKWLSWAAGIRPTVATAFVRLANKASELPQITGALSKGEISFDKATTIARVATPETEQTLVAWAKGGAVSQLVSITSGYLKAKASDDGKDGAHLRRHLSYFFTEDGAFRMRAQMSADQGVMVARALDAAADALFEEQRTFKDHELSEHHDGQQRRTRGDHLGSRQADALVSLAETFLREGPADVVPSERYKVLVHVDAAALAGDPDATSELEDGVGISHETALRLSCDCKIQALLEQDGIPIKLGRERRVVSPALRRVLQARDRCCVFPGCSARRRLQAHHVKHWVRDSGDTDPDNLALLCPRHHRLMHEGRYTMTFDGVSPPRFFRPDGSEVERVPKWPELAEVEHYEWMNEDDFDYDTWATDYDSFDLSEAVGYLLTEDRLALERGQPDGDRDPPPARAPDKATSPI